VKILRFNGLTAWGRNLFIVLIIVIFFCVVNLLYQAQKEHLSPQSLANLKFAEDSSFLSALKTYPTYWPPFYPTVLRLFGQLGIPIRKFNQLCFCFILLLTGYYTKRYIKNIHWIYIIAFLVLLNTNYVNIYQQVSEPLFVLLALVMMLIMLQYRHAPTISKLVWLAVLTSMSCLTRFFAFFWTLPLCLVYIWWNNSHNTIQGKVLCTGVFLGIVGILVSPWLIHLRLLTGSFSGMDRFGSRGFSKYGELLTTQDTLYTNLKAALKTIVIDFLSPYRYATHGVVNNSSLSILETCLAIIVLLLLVLMVLVICSMLYHSLWSHIRGWFVDSAFGNKIIPFHFALFYFVSIIVMWTLTNNDPIYTRFMYPMYLFAVLSIFSLYSSIKDSIIYKKLPFILLYWLLLGVNCYKDLKDLFK
jgi:hypothetical protein